MKNLCFFVMVLALMSVVVGLRPETARAVSLPYPAAKSYAGLYQLSDASGAPICTLTLVSPMPPTKQQPQPLNRMSARNCPANFRAFDMWFPTTNSITMTSRKPPREVEDFIVTGSGTYVASDPKTGPEYQLTRVAPEIPRQVSY